MKILKANRMLFGTAVHYYTCSIHENIFSFEEELFIYLFKEKRNELNIYLFCFCSLLLLLLAAIKLFVAR